MRALTAAANKFPRPGSPTPLQTSPAPARGVTSRPELDQAVAVSSLRLPALRSGVSPSGGRT